MKTPATSRAAEGAAESPNRAAMMSSGPPGKSAAGKNAAPPTQDRWFDTQLNRMYSDLSTEPLPKEMLALLEKLRAAKEPKS